MDSVWLILDRKSLALRGLVAVISGILLWWLGREFYRSRLSVIDQSP